MSTEVKGPVVIATAVNGRLAYSESQKGVIVAFLRCLEGKPVRVRYERYKQARTMKQNAYYWAVPISMIAAQTGHSSEEIHYCLKDMFLPKKFIQMGSQEIEIRKTTTDLKTTEFEDYLESVRAWAAQELGLRIPLPNEV